MVEGETIAGRRVLFVMAVDAEYGPHLRARFTPLLTGVGPV
ncbi:MAG: 5'-methylthioadenosine/S-adenosylhomocysteine nucleosidase, partial [Pseudomonadota bacterium]|nr:5'-methylthioadenosine/S-adenosylhomocysteine nucleosidase [Pseudomonadota bacterium]